MKTPICKILGLFKAGESGAGGQYQPFIPPEIRQNLFNRVNLAYGLAFNPGYVTGEDDVIIDLVYDGITITDPHRSRPMAFVTNYPGTFNGWYGPLVVPNYTRYSKPGVHAVVIKVAPRKRAQYFRGRDFSEEAGGVIGDPIVFTILPELNPASD
ncbi:hypothetical protein CCP3SC15_420008 [Gammaproteobacteria bacterium]